MTGVWKIEEVAESPAKPQRKRFIDRYQRLPGWVLLLQLFLAAGWGRAGVAHALSRGWWSGEEILDFLANDTEHRIGLYEWVLTSIVQPLPLPTAVVVGIGELIIAAMLALNYRTSIALAAGAFLNVQFILAGVVNPSVFYLVATLGIVIWQLETMARPTTIRRLAAIGPAMVIAAVVVLAPSVRTLRPEAAIEDPALVLIFLVTLTTVGFLWVARRTEHGLDVLAALTADDEAVAPEADSPSPLWSVVAIGTTIAILVAGLVVLSAQYSGDRVEPASGLARSGASEDAAALAAPGPGTFQDPYPVFRTVTVTYDEPASGQEMAWDVQVVEPLIDRTDDYAIELPEADDRLATARIRITYRDGPSPGPVSDLRFTAVGPRGAVFASTTERCGDPPGRLAREAELQPSGAVEGLVCWEVPADDLGALVLAVDAGPADGVVYLALS